MKISKIVASLLVVGASVAFANGMIDGCGDKNSRTEGSKMQKSDMKSKNNDKRNHHKSMDFVKTFMDSIDTLELSTDQKASIKKIFDGNKPKIISPVDAFGDTKFDAQKFVDIMQNQKSEMMKHQADIIGKVYGILTTEQKVTLKKELEKQRDNQSKMMKGKYDKSDACRR